MKEDIAGSNERGSRREERTRQGQEIGQIYRKKEGLWKIRETKERGRDAQERGRINKRGGAGGRAGMIAATKMAHAR